MIKKLYLGLIVMLICISAHAQDDQSLPGLFDLAAKTENYFEGFQKNLGDNEFIYQCFRSDITDCLLTRCTDGNMTIKWETQGIPSQFDNGFAGFLWIAAMDVAPDNVKFDFSVNGIKRFTIPTSTRQNWSLTSADGGELSFYTVETDQHGDAHGYMTLKAPAGWLKPGKPQVLEITGESMNSNCWIIVYRAADALKFLRNSIALNSNATLVFSHAKGKIPVEVKMPVLFAGKSLTYNSRGGSGKFLLTKNGNSATGNFDLRSAALNGSFTLSDPNDILFQTGRLGEAGSSTLLSGSSVLYAETRNNGDNGFIIKAQRTYRPSTVSSIKQLAASPLDAGKIILMNSSHQDIAWMDSPEKCILLRDTMLLAPLLEKAEADKNYRFDIEDALMLREFIHRHPEKKSLIEELLNDGRLSCGSSYNMPYEEMYSGESLVREFLLGAKWLKDEFNYTADTYWNVDVPGRTPQMPQLLKKAGSDNMVISRLEKGMYKWYSPDGSYVTTYSPGHYSDAFMPLHKNFYDAAQYIASSSMVWEPYFTGQAIAPVIPVLSDWDMSPANDYSNIINRWEDLTVTRENKPAKSLPVFQIATAPEFFNAWEKSTNTYKELDGERPDVWLYIHGPSHERALTASREGDILLTMAEKFSTAHALVEGSFRNYPAGDLYNCWLAKIYPDHGWGGKHGDITDNLFLSKYEFSKMKAEEILKEQIDQIASGIKTDPARGIPVVVFNSLSWKRNDPARFRARFNPGQAKNITLTDASGSIVPVQVTGKDHYPDGSLKSAEVTFIATGVPSIGYKTYYYKPEENLPSEKKDTGTDVFENQFYRATFSDGGLKSLYDKGLDKELIDASEFKAGEVFTLRSVGNGAGEFSDVQQPDMEGFDKTGDYNTGWKMVESGPVFTAFKMRSPLRYATVEETIIFYSKVKRVDFRISILNWEGVLYREFRMAMPLNMKNGEVTYEVPFGKVTVGKDEIKGAAGERYTTECSKIHPRSIENWIGADGNGFGVTLSSSVMAADWIDPANPENNSTILQPILLASRKSCHSEGNEYLQTGDHYFTFSLTSHEPGWQHGYRSGKESNEELQTSVNPGQYKDANLPEETSFFSVDSDNFIISAVKKAEDDPAVILRFYEMEGKDSTPQIVIFSPVKKAFHTTLIEKPEVALPVTGKTITVPTGHNAIETILVK